MAPTTALSSTAVPSSTTMANNVSHIQPKQPLKRYICSFCARTFSRSEHKLRHERSHTKEKPFDCKICSSAFVRRDLLQRHCRTVHGVVIKTNNQQHSLVNSGNDAGAGAGAEENLSLGQGLGLNLNLSVNFSNNSSTSNNNSTNYVSPPSSTTSSSHNNNPAAPSDQQHRLSLSSVENGGLRQMSQSSASDLEFGGQGENYQQQQQLQPQLQHQPQQQQSQQQSQQQPQSQSQSQNSNKSSVLSEKNIISLLSLCKKFNYLTIPYELDNAICNYFLTYGTRCHNILPLIKFDRILNLNENDELLFIILCIGANENNNLLDAIKLFNKSWSIINDKINNHKVDYNSENIDEFVESVIMLSYIYLNYFDNYFDQNLLAQSISVEIDVLFEYLTSVILTQILNEGRLLNGGSSLSVEELSRLQFPVKLNYWHAHVLLLQFCFIYNKPPTILHSFLLNKRLPIEDRINHNATLSEMLKNLTVSSSSHYTKLGQQDQPGSRLFKKLGLIDNIIIASLMNELLCLRQRPNDPKQTSYAKLTSTFFNRNKNFFHNSVILANKYFNHGYEEDESANSGAASGASGFPAGSASSSSNLTSHHPHHHHNQYNMNQPVGLLNDGVDNLTVFSRNGHSGNWTVSNRSINNLPYIQFLNMLIMCKRKMLISCPLKFIDLITTYVFLPKDQANWALLILTLKEFNTENQRSKFDPQYDNSSTEFFDLKKFIDLTNLPGPGVGSTDLSVDQISENINTYINFLYPSSFVINNNLGISTLPVLYLALNNVNNNLVNFKNFLNLPSNKRLIVGFIVESFLTLIRVLVNYRYRLFNIKSPDTQGSAYNSSNMLVTSPEGFLENSILSVILYFMDQCGSNVLSKLPQTGNKPRDEVIPGSTGSTNTRPRSNSISIGEFDHHNERFKFSLLDKFNDDPKSSPEYPPLVKILSNDFKYYYYLKNLENGLINWLNVFIVDPLIICSDNLDHLLRYRNFIAGLQKSLNRIYSSLDLTADPLPVPTKISSPELKPRAHFNDLDFQQQLVQQQSFTSLLNSQHHHGFHNDLLNLQKHNQQLHIPSFTANDQQKDQQRHNVPSLQQPHQPPPPPSAQQQQQQHPPPPPQHKIILPPIAAASSTASLESGFSYPHQPRPPMLASKFGMK